MYFHGYDIQVLMNFVARFTIDCLQIDYPAAAI
jgi:hypothetical protein